MTNPKAHRLVQTLSQTILDGFEDYIRSFARITRGAWPRFETRDWKAVRQATSQRLGFYAAAVIDTVNRIQRRLGVEYGQKPLWQEVKPVFWEMALQRPDGELACTFFNSVSRKVLESIGFEPTLAFVDPPELEYLSAPQDEFLFRQQADRITGPMLETLLAHYGFRTPFIDLAADARLCALRITAAVQEECTPGEEICLEMVRAPFFRGMSAYLVGRIMLKERSLPLAFSIHNTAGGLQVDALLTTTAQLRVLFSFSHAYFHVETRHPAPLVAFLQTLMPHKRLAELYIALGYHKHGKTELYRDLLKHQRTCSLDRFDFAPGEPGMVMIAFNMPNDDLIYKLIRDRFASPKKTSAQQVMEKYEYVFHHDRVGRLLDVQTFEHLELEDCCFTSRLLQEINREAKQAATVSQGRVVLEHAYVERRVTPLDIYLASVDGPSTAAAVLDYGQAIKDLAQANIFPGDMLVKNFGVTNMGRVVFYDYDELRPLTECNFRQLPQARQYEDDLDAEPWFMVAENDVFPAEFAVFLGLPTDLRQIFLTRHKDLLTPEFWWQTQDQIRSGTWVHIRPYGEAQRLYPGA